jgi:phosphatidate cytidylyltransferase
LLATKEYEVCEHGSKLLLMLFALVWINDAGAYFAGKSLGKRKFAPVISPNKTWEGAIGGFLATVILGMFIGGYSSIFTFRQGLFLGVLLGVIAPIGDLLESAIKRGAGVKDSGTLLPGHGGVLDRIDSVIFCAPVFYFYVFHMQHAPILRMLNDVW